MWFSRHSFTTYLHDIPSRHTLTTYVLILHDISDFTHDICSRTYDHIQSALHDISTLFSRHTLKTYSHDIYKCSSRHIGTSLTTYVQEHINIYKVLFTTYQHFSHDILSRHTKKCASRHIDWHSRHTLTTYHSRHTRHSRHIGCHSRHIGGYVVRKTSSMSWSAFYMHWRCRLTFSMSWSTYVVSVCMSWAYVVRVCRECSLRFTTYRICREC